MGIFGIDFNHFNATTGPVLLRCTDTQATDPKALCSLGPIMFDANVGPATYNGLLVRVERRLSHGLQFLGSYALSSNVGTNGTGPGFNLYNLFENYGPLDTDRRHLLSVSGILDLPKKLQLSWSALYYSKSPFSVVVGDIDFNGDGIRSDLLPGTKVNQFNRGLGKRDLVRLVNDFNANYAGKKDSGGKVIPTLMLPSNYDFNSRFFTLDQRISRTWAMRERWRITLLGEVFNLFNVANLGGYGTLINNSATFGQPTTRVDQAFGSGGPRSFQLAARISF